MSRTTATTARSRWGRRSIRLRPAPHCRTPDPQLFAENHAGQHFINWQQDPHGNWQARLVFPGEATEFKVEVDLTADMAMINPFDFFVEPYAENFPFAYDRRSCRRARRPISKPNRRAAPRRRILGGDRPPRAQHVDFLVELNAGCSDDVGYVIRMEPGVQTPDETLALRSRLLPRLRLAAGAAAAASRPRRPLRLRLSHPAQGRRRSARRAAGHGQGFHRSPCLGRGLSSRRRLGRPGRDLRPALRRRPPAALRDAALPLRRADHRRGRAGGGRSSASR